MIGAAALLALAFVNRNASDEHIGVTGLGEKDFEADLVVWTGSFSHSSPSSKEAYAKLNADQERIRAFLAAKGVANDTWSRLKTATITARLQFGIR